MDSEKKHIIYTAEDIQHYLSGKLLPAEMHAMEKAALDDAFLAEAMEGYALMQEKEWDQQLLALRNNFSKAQTAKTVSLKPPSRFMMWKVAAAVIILISGIAVTYFFTSDKTAQHKSIAAVSIAQDSATGTTAEATVIDSSIKSSSRIAEITDSNTAEKPVAATEAQKNLADSAFIYRPGIAAKEELKQEVAGGGYVEEKVTGKTDDLAISNAAPSALQNNRYQNETSNNNAARRQEKSTDNNLKKQENIARSFTAQVIGPDSTPLPFANIILTKEGISTYSDAEGNFNIKSHDSILNINLQSYGYIPRNFTVRADKPPFKIVLKENALTLKEKTSDAVVIGYGTKRRAATERDFLADAEPADGWEKYNIYITNNLIRSNEIFQKKIHGEVVISIEINSDGSINHAKVVQSLCKDCDEAALRVIKEGPRWKVRSGKTATADIKVKF